MAEITQVTTHTADAQARLITQYQGSENMEAIVSAFGEQIQNAEDTLYDVLVQSAIDDAIGLQLDDIGDIVGQKRQGMEDAEYRTFVRARIKANRSSGRPEELIEILYLILSGQPVPPSDPIMYRELYPASIEMESSEVTSSATIIWRDFLNRAKPAGVRLGFIYTEAAAADAFTFSDQGGGTTTGEGYGDTVAGLVGGVLASVAG